MKPIYMRNQLAQIFANQYISTLSTSLIGQLYDDLQIKVYNGLPSSFIAAGAL